MTAGRALKEKLKGLYAITDENLITEKRFVETVELALQGGATVIQYRDKSSHQQKRLQQALALASLCKQYQAIYLINDDIELAAATNADGVHLGSNDASITQARQALGKDAIIGISCYNKIELAVNAEKNTADYVAFGAIFPSTTKPEAASANLKLIAEAKQKLSIPVCAIGGITDSNIKQLIQQGVDMAAVINNLFAGDDVKKAAASLSKYFH